MTSEGGRPAGAVAAAAAGAGLVVLFALVVFASSSGSVDPVSESTLRRTEPPGRPPVGETVPTQSPPTATPTPLISHDPWGIPGWLSTLLETLVLSLGLVAILLVVRYVVRRAIDFGREVKVPQGLDNDPAFGERMVSDEELADAVETGLGSVDTGTPSNAIVACWLALEKTAAAAGVPRRVSETPSEFTVRVLGAAQVSRPALDRLAELYREARFSEHDLPESARFEARRALTVLHDELLAPRGSG